MDAELRVALPTLYGFLLVLARVGGALVFVPLPGFRSGPEPARVALGLGFAVALFPVWRAAPVSEPGIGQLAIWLLAEAAFGITVGIGVSFLSETLLVACQVIGLQAGYSYASTIDPATEADSNVLQVFAQIMGSLLFFTLGVDRQVMRVFARSLEVYPPGMYVGKLASAEAVIGWGADMFSTGLRLAMPVVALLVVVDIALALLGRLHAQLQLLMLAFPVKMLAGLALLAAIAVVFLPVYRAAAARTVESLLGLMAGHGG
jgi:flagellar biosynthetic protein FliR